MPEALTPVTFDTTAFDTSRSGDEFGRSIAVSGDVMAVGVPNDNNVLSDDGTVVLYRQIGGVWTYETRLGASAPGANDHFGSAVALDESGHRLVVGSPDRDEGGVNSSGAAYVFHYDGATWTEIARLVGMDFGLAEEEANATFGAAVAISGDYVAVGAEKQDHSSKTNPGSAYVYKYDAVTDDYFPDSGVINEPVPGGYHFFGHSLALESRNGDPILVVGAEKSSLYKSDGGAAYVYRRDSGTDTWAYEQELTGPVFHNGDNFGSAVAISYDRIAVGMTHGDSAVQSNSGLAHIFEHQGAGGWVHTVTLAASNPASGDLFGIQIALDGDTLVVGADRRHGEAGNTGAAYIFRYYPGDETWAEEYFLEPLSPAQLNSNFGAAVSVEGRQVVVGAPKQHGGDINNSGIAYAYRLDYGGPVVSGERFLAPGANPPGDRFGQAVYINAAGDGAVVGAPNEDGHGGSAYFLSYDAVNLEWELDGSLDPGESTVTFGNAIVIDPVDANRCFVADADGAAANAATRSGAIYYFERQSGSWTMAAKLEPSAGRLGRRFGWSLAMNESGTRLVVGAPGDDERGFSAGAVYVYDYDGSAWNFTTKLTVENSVRSFFGYAVAVRGARIAVGAPAFGPRGSNRGRAWVFDVDGNGQVMERLEIPHRPVDHELFGWACTIDTGDVLYVSAVRGRRLGVGAGAVYVYDYVPASESYEFRERVVPDAGRIGDNFGQAVTVDSGTSALVVGAASDIRGGYATVFQPTGGRLSSTQQFDVGSTMEQAGDHFSRSLSAANGRLIVGIPRDDEQGGESGSVAFYDIAVP